MPWAAHPNQGSPAGASKARHPMANPMRLTSGYQSHPRHRAESEYDPGMPRTPGADYEALKALLREEAKRHMLARSRVRNAQVTAADRAVRDALALYQRHPTLAYAREGLMHARARRQALANEAAIAAARKAQVVWQHYGEQPTFWFHWLTRERQQLTTIDALRCGPHPDSPAVPLDAARRSQGTASLFFSKEGHV